jgi:hypothetical protein
MSGATGGTEETGTIVGLQINKASYGVAPSSLVDVTAETAALIKDGNVNFTVSPQAFGVLDPAPGVKKTFQGSFVINNGRPTILTKDDGEVFDLTAPTLDKKEKLNYAGIFGTSVFYFLISLSGVYFSYSAYRLVNEGIGSSYQIFGIFLGLMILGSFVSFGAADVQYGILGLIISLPSLIFSFLFLVFLILCYDLDFINFSYLGGIKNN